MRLPAKLARTPDEWPSASTTDVLQARGVCKRFGTHCVLNDVSLTLRHREVLALCGPSGCGKTTLIRIICGLEPHHSGQLAIDGAIVRAGAPYPAHLYGRIGVVFQEHNLFPHLTALANVMLGLREFKKLSVAAARARGMAELDRMGVAALAHRHPAALSGGERQRVAIARALAMDPLLLLLDEPTADLDPDRVDEVCDRVIQLAESGTTMVLVTHDVECARRAAGTFALLRNGVCSLSNDSALLDDLRCRRK
jgi:ABC-type polar amino acid transport system ATPase subunit